jgi:hypothetical protein
MDTSAVHELVQTSPLLSEQERAYWFSHLPGMTDVQVQKLADILTPLPPAFQEQVTQYFASLGRAATQVMQPPATA